MPTAYKFRLYPTKEQEQKLIWTLNKCRFVYNKLLERFNEQRKMNRNELQHYILEIKGENPELSNVYSKVLQYENYRLFSNLRTLSGLKKKGKKVGKLRFKSKDRFKTFSYNQNGFMIIKNEKRRNKLLLSKIGEIPFIMHRSVKGEIKQVTIKRYASGKLFAFIICENKQERLVTNNTNKVGIDLGLTNYVYDSDGNVFDNPKHLYKSIEKLNKEQRRLSRKKKGSKNSGKARLKVAKIYEKVVNQRNDFLHKLSRFYVGSYGFVAVENLKVSSLVMKSNFAKSISDASWSKFVHMLEYKAERAGTQVVKVEPGGTTQTCSNCGREVHKELWNRSHNCVCGLEIDRDYNSAINILKRALGQELPEYTPVETGPLLISKQVRSMKQEVA